MCSLMMRARWPIGTPSSTQSSRSSAGIARKSTPFATNPPAYCGSSSAARNAAMSFGREAGVAYVLGDPRVKLSIRVRLHQG